MLQAPASQIPVERRISIRQKGHGVAPTLQRSQKIGQVTFRAADEIVFRIETHRRQRVRLKLVVLDADKPTLKRSGS